MIERLAALEHEQWAHWTKYMLDNLTAANIERWKRQIETAYADLTEAEKSSDRVWAQKVLDVMSVFDTPKLHAAIEETDDFGFPKPSPLSTQKEPENG
jgi:hypothetical protein